MQRGAGQNDAGGRSVSETRPALSGNTFECPQEGPLLSRVQDALDLIGAARSAGASLVVIPVNRLTPSFFELRTMLAGEMLQKFATYQVRVAIVGDTSALCTESKSLRDFIREANRGEVAWFVQSREELELRLARGSAESSGAPGA